MCSSVYNRGMRETKNDIRKIIHWFVNDLVTREVHDGEDGDEDNPDIRVMRQGNSPDYESLLEDVVDEIFELQKK